MKQSSLSTATKYRWITWLAIPEKILLVTLLVAPVCALATELNGQYPPLYFDGTDIENACQPSELKKLREAVLELTAGRAPDDVWRLISTLLCASKNNTQAERMIKLHLPKKIRSSFFGSGDEEKTARLVTPSSLDLMADREAWAARVDGYGRTDMSLSYRSNAACINGIDLQFNGQGWLIVGVDGACD